MRQVCAFCLTVKAGDSPSSSSGKLHCDCSIVHTKLSWLCFLDSILFKGTQVLKNVGPRVLEHRCQYQANWNDVSVTDQPVRGALPKREVGEPGLLGRLHAGRWCHNREIFTRGQIAGSAARFGSLQPAIHGGAPAERRIRGQASRALPWQSRDAPPRPANCVETDSLDRRVPSRAAFAWTGVADVA